MNNITFENIAEKILILKSELKRLEWIRNEKIVEELKEISLDNKFKYSYRDIAKKYNLCVATVQKIAEKNKIKRK